MHPLSVPSSLPYSLPPFAEVDDTAYLSAFEYAMDEHRREIDALVAQDGPVTFQNTIVALEESGAALRRVSTVFWSLISAHASEGMRAVETDIASKLSAHRDTIAMNGDLFKRIESLYQNAPELNPESQRLLERYREDYRRAGANLSKADQEKLRVINARLAELSTAFGQNLQADANEGVIWVDDVKDLGGLSADAVSAASVAAESRGKAGSYAIPLVSPTLQPALASLENRALRERLFKASNSRGRRGNANDNRALIREMVALRAERATLLGFETHAEYVLADSTAQTPAAVEALLRKVMSPALKNAEAEANELRAFMSEQGVDHALEPWDWDYYASKLRARDHQFDAARMRPYLLLDNVLTKGLFFMAEKLYGLRFEERTDLPLYHEDVRIFEAFEENGEPLGLFIFDPFARESKKGGAWMNSYVRPSTLDGAKPVVANHLNIARPSDGEPALMTFREVNTAFHEFGHALHGLLSNVTYPRFAGTAVPRDFVEFPSQVHEMWATWPEVLENYARHYETGEKIPKELLDGFLGTQSFNQGYDTSEYLKASWVDFKWHMLSGEESQIEDVYGFERAALEEVGAQSALVPPRYHSTYFAHIFAGGYSAGYYSYFWSEVLDADAVEWFEANGGLNRKSGDWFREKLLSRGGAEDAMTLYRAFRGSDPSTEPLLRRRGLSQD